MPGEESNRPASEAALRRNREAMLDVMEVMSKPVVEIKTKINRVLEIAADRTGYPLVYFSHVDEQSQQFLVVEDRIGVEAVSEGNTGPLSESYCRYSVAGDDEVTVLEAGRDLPRDDPAYRKFGFEQYVGVPVRARGNIYGSLCFAAIDGRETAFAASIETFLRVMSRWLGHEIERMEQKRHTDVLERVLRHNLRNSLTVIHGHASALEVGPTREGSVAAIRDETQSLIEMANEVQELDQLIHSKTPLEVLDVVGIVRQAVRSIRMGRPDAIIDVESPDAASVTGITELRIAVEELLDNAVKHADQAEPHVDVRVEANDQHVSVQIEDDGPGIPAEEVAILQSGHDIEQIQHGSGMGLWLVRRIVQQSNGTLTFDADGHRGTVVEIDLSKAETDAN